MRRRQVLTGFAALGVTAVSDAALLPAPKPAAGVNAGTRETWPETGAGNAQVEVTFRVGTARRALALTFDDGPDPRWTPQVLDALDRHDARATFFVVGERARRHPGLLRRLVEGGHAIGNHTYVHADLTGVSAKRAAAELAATNDAITEITGSRPTLLRPPYGHIDPVALLAAAETRLDVVLWSQRVRGSEPEADAQLCLRDARPGSIVLAHDGGPTPTRALMRTLAGLVGDLTADGYALVDVPTLLRTGQGAQATRRGTSARRQSALQAVPRYGVRTVR